ncbi:hypothetical protein PZ61_0235930 [Streptomyces sp. MNU77]|uniref:GntR family transcriptional regulator n=1 Tax=Streptomyces sp. MNU77 TaxID=1573406 RepID=UPI000696E6C1|nr:GntR family transcriptional regulator [Streptomyces sp. MNU77]OLO25824.1 hypothetical protein PZ61_0235930 [Streptomyces sp. MNU77]
MTASPAVSGVQHVQRVRLVDEVAHQLRELILDGVFPPGKQLLQIELAAQLGVSRTPLREAFRVLERDGLIQVSNGNKTVEVVALTAREIIDLYEVREMIDGLAARKLARQGLPHPVDERLASLLRDMEEATDAEPFDTTAYGEAHQDFHVVIVEQCGNRRLIDMLPVVRMSTQMLLTRHFLASAGSGVDEPAAGATVHDLVCVGNRDHRELYEAIREGRSHDAETVARRHNRAAGRAIARMGNEEQAAVPSP